MNRLFSLIIVLFLLGSIAPQVAHAQGADLLSQAGSLTSALGGGGTSGLQTGMDLFKQGKKVADPLMEVFSEMGPVQQYELGREVAARLLGAYKAVPASHPAAQYLARVGSTVALASNNPYPYNDYLFILLDSSEINAFATPGGFVFVTTGMLGFLQNEEELAAILGHEVAHVELQHGIQAVGKENSIKLAMAIKDVAVDESNLAGSGKPGSPEALKLMDELSGKMMNSIRTGYNVKMESAADSRSIAISQSLGYDPLALAGLLGRFKQATHSYGGANYPAEREALARACAQSLGAAASSPAHPVRNQRFVQAVGTLKR